MRDNISKIPAAPKAFVPAFATVNQAIALLNALAALEVGGGLKLTKSEGNWLLELDPGTDEAGALGGGGGVPEGYAEEQFTICEDGAPVDVYLLVRRDEEEE